MLFAFKVNIIVPEVPVGGINVAFSVLALGWKIPPKFDDQVPPVAPPETLPAKLIEPPEQVIL